MLERGEEPRIAPEKGQQATTRLKAIEGQIRGLERMISEDRYCVDILTQIAAVQEALQQVGKIIMRNYLENCVTRSLRSDKPGMIFDELMDVIYKFRK